MSFHFNYLRTYRKRSCLTQADIAFLMGLSDYSNLSRCEKGERSPSLEMTLAYHLLFEAPIEVFFKRHKEALKVEIANRIKELLLDLRVKDKIPKVAERIAFLQSALNRLNNTSPTI